MTGSAVASRKRRRRTTAGTTHAVAAPRTDRLALRALQVGAVSVVLAALPNKLFELDRFFVPKELVLHLAAAAAALWCLRSARRLAPDATDALLLGYLALGAVSAVFATNPWLAARACGISLSGLLLFWAARALSRAGLGRPLRTALAAAVVLGAVTSLLQAYGLRTEYVSLNRAPGGTLGNRNFVAHLAAIGLPTLALCALEARRWRAAAVASAGVGIVAAALVLSRSRGAWLALAVATALLAVAAFTARERWGGPTVRGRLALLALTAALGAGAAVVLPNTLEWKSDSPYLDSVRGVVNYKEGSGRGRLIQYRATLRLAVARPALGVGPGNWAVAYPRVAERGDPSLDDDTRMTANPWPSSDWIAILSERGVPAFLLLLAALGALAIGAWRKMRGAGARGAAGAPEVALRAAALLATLAITAVVGAFDAVLLLPASAFFAWTILGALSEPAGRAAAGKAGRGRPLTMVVVGLLGTALTVRSAAQVAAMTAFGAGDRTSEVRRASRLDPGSYRIRIRLAEMDAMRGRCDRVRADATAARQLFPEAPEPRELLAACGVRVRRR